MFRGLLPKLQADMLVMRVRLSPGDWWSFLVKGFKVLGTILFHPSAQRTSQRSREESWILSSLWSIPELIRRRKEH